MAMIYDATSKLEFGEDPVMKIRDVELTIKSDAAVMMKVLDVLRTKGEVEAAQEVMKILLSEEDLAKLEGLHLKIRDYVEVMRLTASLAMGEDPDGEEEGN